ncbi:MAG: aromatic acid exporter family protein [Bacillota bacterium]|nr:aromatic acid exporter family protein [Bacillota bacterium]
MENESKPPLDKTANETILEAIHPLIPGMRIIKTAIAVFLCLTLDFLRGTPYPIQSSIAAVICLQPDIRSSRAIAGNRVLGTFSAGIYSYLFLLLFVEGFHVDPAGYLFYSLVAAGIIPLILIVLMLKRPGSVIIASVVFLIICLTKGEQNTLIFTIERVLDTLLGIGFALLVNWFPLLNRHRPQTTEQNPE